MGRGSPLRPCRRAAEMVPRGALVLGELRAAPVRLGWAGAPQRGRGNGGKVVRKRGGEDGNMYSKVLRWDSLDFSKKLKFRIRDKRREQTHN